MDATLHLDAAAAAALVSLLVELVRAWNARRVRQSASAERRTAPRRFTD
jgi:hypothetical protein